MNIDFILSSNQGFKITLPWSNGLQLLFKIVHFTRVLILSLVYCCILCCHFLQSVLNDAFIITFFDNATKIVQGESLPHRGDPSLQK